MGVIWRTDRMTDSQNHTLHSLARSYSVQTTYHDGLGRFREPFIESVMAVLQELGAPLERLDDSAEALRQRRQMFWGRVVEPALVSWNGAPVRLKLRLPKRLAEAPVRYRVTLESGEVLTGACRNDPRFRILERRIDGARYVMRQMILPEQLPLGYHRLHLRIRDLAIDSYLFSAIPETYGAADARAREWGLFCPLYALHSNRSWGAGDFSDLAVLADITSARGGRLVGTLPLLASFLDEPFNPSPYAPVSRLFWNEFYLDVTDIVELDHSSAAKEMIASTGFQAELQTLRSAPLVDYRGVMALKRRVLELLHCILVRGASERKARFDRFVATHPCAADYARFRATVERQRVPWEQWPARQRDGTLQAGDYDGNVKHYHLYVQWLAAEQMQALGEKTAARGSNLYLDFPLGVNRDGYDVWRERELFALNISGGAPPDDLFVKGQNWGFPPLRPDTLRGQGYRYYIECLRHHLQYARALRIDHVMGLHRLYWIPQGFAAGEGVYVHYQAEEFYAILSLESHRHQARVIGENLGTVPPYVNTAMARHKIYGMHVGQFGVRNDPNNALDAPPQHTIASLNTHDTPTFAGFWTAADIDDRRALELLGEPESVNEYRARASQREALAGYLRARNWLPEAGADPVAILKAWLCLLASSDVDMLLINLEDLWLEAAPQNVPGTWQERPNWRRKARLPMADICTSESVTEILQAVNHNRERDR
jgi:4-alpha-glucanotransferase